ncbi:Mobile element protein [Microcystis panniformis FACHB-1757]|uniref:Mobile element protein n=1 Tax=Microcystis panniformis FACHB-1757 TaxID=1638788 RepID=A0A0K1S1D7_9CHRO|nr:Mobile element protein [Microcystis panniformis FACHB-1757]
MINVGDLLFMIAIFINIFSWIIKLWLNYDEDLELTDGHKWVKT